MRRTAPGLLSALAVVLSLAPSVCVGGEAIASASSATVQPTGPRSGATGVRFLNVEGKNNEKYASFGVLDFKPGKLDANDAVVLTLSLTQSIAKFSKSGKIKVYLSADAKSTPETLKFKGDDGLDGQLAPLYPVGESTFEKGETGKQDSIALKLDHEALAAFRSQVAETGVVRLVLVPADAEVAATYFGTGSESPEQRPRLVFKTTP
ncbi:MAG: hypothetical protein P4L84_11490 [Isosphaeraceae bacterium]|nr:hypothetical protein [Isosphaeraceae bacterium]